ncbi:MAG: right-handed parallel beta-helix repeat-containing protein [Calditrichota bacterium]
MKLFASAGLVLLAMTSIGQSEQIVQGQQYGRWTIENSPFRVQGDITVPYNERLIIDPDVNVTFEGNYYFNVRGWLTAEGGENHRIRFSRVDSSQWQGIYFHERSDARSIISYCDIVNARIGISLDFVSPLISHNNIYAQSTGIDCRRSDPEIIENDYIFVGGDSAVSEARGINLVDGSDAQVLNNRRIEVVGGPGGQTIGIYVERSIPNLFGNWIEVRSSGSVCGIILNRFEKACVQRNLIRVRSPHEMVGIWTLENSEGASLRNNTIVLLGSSSGATGLIIGQTSEVIVLNNILVGTGGSVGINSTYGTVHRTSGYNDIWNHGVAYIGDWRGNHDIYSDPLFFDPQDNPQNVADTSYTLTWDDYPYGNCSPCIDAGHPGYQDPDHTRSDIGRYPYYQRPVTVRLNPAIIPESFDLFTTFPNPFNQSLSITIRSSGTGPATLEAYNLQGHRIALIWSGETNREDINLTWAPQQIPSGEYFLLWKQGSQIERRKTLYLP